MVNNMTEENLNDISKEQLNTIRFFIKFSMEIDGSVKYKQSHVMNVDTKTLYGLLFECNDSKRGQFYISWLIDKEQLNDMD